MQSKSQENNTRSAKRPSRSSSSVCPLPLATPPPPHLPLTGQAESGKSTMLRSIISLCHPVPLLPHPPSIQTFSSPFVQPTSTTRFQYGRSSYSSISSGIYLPFIPPSSFLAHSSTAPSRSSLPSSTRSLTHSLSAPALPVQTFVTTHLLLHAYPRLLAPSALHSRARPALLSAPLPVTPPWPPTPRPASQAPPPANPPSISSMTLRTPL